MIGSPEIGILLKVEVGAVDWIEFVVSCVDTKMCERFSTRNEQAQL